MANLLYAKIETEKTPKFLRCVLQFNQPQDIQQQTKLTIETIISNPDLFFKCTEEDPSADPWALYTITDINQTQFLWRMMVYNKQKKDCEITFYSDPSKLD